jgi:hypothetical protein
MFKHKPYEEMPGYPKHQKVFTEDGKKFMLWGSQYFVLPANITELTVEEFVNIGCFELSIRAMNALRNFLGKDTPICTIFDIKPEEVSRTPNCGRITFNEISYAVRLLAEIYGWKYYYDKNFLAKPNYVEPHRKTPPEVVIKRAIKTLEKYGYTVVAPNKKAA